MKRFVCLSAPLWLSLLGCLQEPTAVTPATTAPAVTPEVAHEGVHPPTPGAQPAAPPAAQPAAPAPTAAPTPGTAVRRLGAPITETVTVPLAELRRNTQRYAGRPIRIEGVVAAVCQSMGCWMQLSDDAGRVHIRMHGHAFFIPRNASGRRATVQGTVVAANPNGHCEQEAADQTGQPVARLELDATGVELL